MYRRILEPTANWFPSLQLLDEASVGTGLAFGFLTPIPALVGIAMNLYFLALAGARPTDRSVNPCYQCEQGQSLVMIVSEVVVFFLGAGATRSLDSLLGFF